MPRVSVLLPCYNVQELAGDALASLLSQTFHDFEILAMDDGSTDGTRALLSEYARADSRVRVLDSAHRGIVAALQSAAAAAGGEYLARMDADDIAAPDRLSIQVRLLDDRPDIGACGAGVAYFPADVVRDGARRYERWINALHDPDALARDIFVECPIAHPTLVVRRSLFEDVGGYVDRGWPEDYDLVLRLWQSGARFANVPEVLHKWRERPERLSRTDARYSAEAFRRCKARYLAATLVRDRDVLVWGAGPVGKAFARALRAEHVHVSGFIDIDSRKVGQRVHGVRVHDPDVLRSTDAFVVAAVGAAGAREQIRAVLSASGRVELRDYCAVA